MKAADDVEIPVLDVGGLPPEVGEAEVDVELQEVDSCWALGHGKTVEGGSDGTTAESSCASVDGSWLRSFGPARVRPGRAPRRRSRCSRERGYTACEIDFEGGSGWSKAWAGGSASSPASAGIALSVHAPLAGFMGHVERDKKHRMADRHARPLGGYREGRGRRARRPPPGLPARPDARSDALAAVVEQLGELPRAARGKGPRGRRSASR